MIAFAFVPIRLPVPRYLHKIDQLDCLGAVDDRRRTRDVPLALEF